MIVAVACIFFTILTVGTHETGVQVASNGLAQWRVASSSSGSSTNCGCYSQASRAYHLALTSFPESSQVAPANNYRSTGSCGGAILRRDLFQLVDRPARAPVQHISLDLNFSQAQSDAAQSRVTRPLVTMASRRLFSVKAQVGRALRDTGAALKLSGGAEVRREGVERQRRNEMERETAVSSMEESSGN